MSEFIQDYVPDWYAIRMDAIKVTEIITKAYCIIEPYSLDTKDFQLWNKRKDKFMKSKEYRDLHTYVSNCCKHSVDCDDAESIFEAVYNVMKPEDDKSVFMKENTKEIAEFITYVVSRCNGSVTTDKRNESMFKLTIKLNNGVEASPQALAIKDHLDCIDLTLNALDLTGESLPEQICVAKHHLKCAELLLGDLVSSMIPMLF